MIHHQFSIWHCILGDPKMPHVFIRFEKCFSVFLRQNYCTKTTGWTTFIEVQPNSLKNLYPAPINPLSFFSVNILKPDRPELPKLALSIVFGQYLNTFFVITSGCITTIKVFRVPFINFSSVFRSLEKTHH